VAVYAARGNPYSTHWTTLYSELSLGDTGYIESRNYFEVLEDTLLGSFDLVRRANYARLVVQIHSNAMQAFVTPGSAHFVVSIAKPSGAVVEIATYDGTTDWTTLVDWVDVSAILDAAGTYELRLHAEVCNGQDEYEIFYHSFAEFGACLLSVDTDVPGQVVGVSAVGISKSQVRVSWTPISGCLYTAYYRVGSGAWTAVNASSLPYTINGLEEATTYEVQIAATNLSGEGPPSTSVYPRTSQVYTKILTELARPTEIFKRETDLTKTLTEELALTEIMCGVFAKCLTEVVTLTEALITHLQNVEKQFCTDLLSLTEGIVLRRVSILTTRDERLLACLDTKSAYTFDTSTPYGVFDTDDEDFGMVGKDKTLSEIFFESMADAPHSVTVSVSTDSGRTWVQIGTVPVQSGTSGTVHPWISAEKFRVRFAGAGLYLCAYTIWAIPRGLL
jgi:hypothetical protein